MLRRPILVNRPLKTKKMSAYRPGLSRPDAACAAEDVEVPAGIAFRRTARLADRLKDAAAER